MLGDDPLLAQLVRGQAAGFLAPEPMVPPQAASVRGQRRQAELLIADTGSESKEGSLQAALVASLWCHLQHKGAILLIVFLPGQKEKQTHSNKWEDCVKDVGRPAPGGARVRGGELPGEQTVWILSFNGRLCDARLRGEEGKTELSTVL